MNVNYIIDIAESRTRSRISRSNLDLGSLQVSRKNHDRIDQHSIIV